MKTERLDMIQEFINEKGTVTLDELVEKFGVSKNTIRRDVQDIIEGGEFKKVYGGVAVNKTNSTVPYLERQIQNQPNKQTIGKTAAKYIEDGDIIFIDSGTTTVELLDNIKDKELTVITNNIDFIFKALPYKNLNILSTGGMVERKTRSFTSTYNDEIINSYNINKAFLASTGISIKSGVTNSLPLESGIKRAVVQRSAKVFLLVDDSKFDKAALTTYCKLDELDCLVTNDIPDEYLEHFKKIGVQVILPQKK